MKIPTEEINQKDIEVLTPTKSGWYICQKFVRAYGCKEDGFRIATLEPVLLYWEDNVWVTSPRSFTIHEKSDIYKFTPLPDDYNFYEKELKIKY